MSHLHHPDSAAADRAAEPEQATVLVIDDDPNISESIKRCFRRYKVNVLQAFHGMQGVSLAAAKKPDLIVTDLRMPQGGGDYVVECLKRNSHTSRIPIIVLTGMANGYSKRRMCDLGADECLTKPVAFDELRKSVGRFIALRKR